MINTIVEAGGEAVTINTLDPFFDVEKGISQLRQEKNAIILAHYYQALEIQDITDFIGDFLDLSRKAAATDADMIVCCGLKFMVPLQKMLNLSPLPNAHKALAT